MNFATPPEKDRATRNARKNLAKFGRVVAAISMRADRQTDRHAHHNALLACTEGRSNVASRRVRGAFSLFTTHSLGCSVNVTPHAC